MSDHGSKLLRQHNAITTARYDMSATEKNIVYILLSQLKDKDSIDCVYKILIKDLEENMHKELNYKHLKDAIKKLIKRVYTIHTPFDNEVLHIGLLTAARYKRGEGTIELEVSRNVRPYLFELKNNFTTLQLNTALSLKSKFSKRIYEMISQFKDTGIMRLTVADLKYRLGLIDPETKKEQYKNFNDFEKRVLLVAQQELRHPTGLSFTYTKKKMGNKVTDLVFKIEKRGVQNLEEQTKEKDPLRIKLVNRFGLSPWQSEIITRIVSPQEINKTLYNINLKLSDGKITNVGGFTARMFDNKYNLGLFSKSK